MHGALSPLSDKRQHAKGSPEALPIITNDRRAGGDSMHLVHMATGQTVVMWWAQTPCSFFDAQCSHHQNAVSNRETGTSTHLGPWSALTQFEPCWLPETVQVPEHQC